MISTPISIPTPRRATKNAPHVVLQEVVVMGASQLHNGMNYNLDVRATNGSTWSLRRAYHQFDSLHDQLALSYLIPPLPPPPHPFNEGLSIAPGPHNPVRVACTQMGAWLMSILRNERVRASYELVSFMCASDGDVSELNIEALGVSASMHSDGLPGMSMDETISISTSSTHHTTGTTRPTDALNALAAAAANSTHDNNSASVATATTTTTHNRDDVDNGDDGGGGGDDVGDEIDDVVFPDNDSGDVIDDTEMTLSDDPATAATTTTTSDAVSLKDFVLLKVIGKGSFGKVMLVRKVDCGEIYAMKVLEKDNVVKRNQVEHTKTERNVLEYVRHPFIVTLRYAFQTKRKLYFVLDYCPGGELFFHLGKAGRFSETRVRFYAAQIVLALQYLHEKSVVYRDLKPENVLLDAAGNIALTDFGLSKEGIVDNASAHSFCGTPEYLAPEILTRSGHGRAADWWSLGALMYEMLSGMPPFYSRDRNRLFKKILRAQLRMPHYFTPDTVSFLEALLHRDPTHRLGSGPDDAGEVKRHAFFCDVNWDDVYNKMLQTPYVPLVRGLLDTNNFDTEFTSMALDKDPASSVSRSSLYSSSVSRGRFQGFTYVNDDDPRDMAPHQQQQHDQHITAVPPS